MYITSSTLSWWHTCNCRVNGTCDRAVAHMLRGTHSHTQDDYYTPTHGGKVDYTIIEGTYLVPQ